MSSSYRGWWLSGALVALAWVAGCSGDSNESSVLKQSQGASAPSNAPKDMNDYAKQYQQQQQQQNPYGGTGYPGTKK